MAGVEREQEQVLRKAVADYVDHGWCVLPANVAYPGDRGYKAPALSWREYQSRRPRPGELERIFRAAFHRFRHSTGPGVGIVTGKVSGLFVLDLDPRKGDIPAGWESLNGRMKQWPQTPTVVTGSGGRHLYFKLPEGEVPRNSAGILPGVDWRAEGGWVVAPPTVRADGGTYQWAKGLSPAGVAVAEMPEWLRVLVQQTRGEQGNDFSSRRGKGWEAEVLVALRTPGRRNDAVTRLAGKFAGTGWPEDVALALILATNAQVPAKDRLSPDEVRETVGRIYQGDAMRHPERLRSTI